VRKYVLHHIAERVPHFVAIDEGCIVGIGVSAAHRGLTRIELTVRVDNERANKLYDIPSSMANATTAT